MKFSLLYITWDASPILFRIPGLELPIYTYGALFSLSFYFAYIAVKRSLTRFYESNNHQTPESLAASVSDQLLWFSIIGCVVGARLGHVLFYNRDYYMSNPLDILKIWQGGLASHGGTLGVILAFALFMYLFREKTKPLTLLKLMDLVVPSVCFVAAAIRIGNFFNQEILGTPSDLPWAVLFLHPKDSLPIVPRHPVQLYEALAYIWVYSSLRFWRKQIKIPGFVTAMFFANLFIARMILEIFKAGQDGLFDHTGFQTGQVLSLPFVIGSILLGFYVLKTKNREPTQSTHHAELG